MKMTTTALASLILAGAVTAPPAAGQQIDAATAGEFPCSHVLAMSPEDAERFLYFLAGRMGAAEVEAGQEGFAADDPDDPRLDPRLMQLMPAAELGFHEIAVEDVRGACEEDPDRAVAELLEEQRVAARAVPSEADEDLVEGEGDADDDDE